MIIRYRRCVPASTYTLSRDAQKITDDSTRSVPSRGETAHCSRAPRDGVFSGKYLAQGASMLVRIFAGAALLFLAMQLVRPKLPSGTPVAEVQAPAAVKEILERSCYACHSNERRLSWFDEVVPAYWLVASE
jgi:hypothetical protein